MLLWAFILSALLIGTIFFLYKLNNIGVFLLTSSTPLIFIFIRNNRLCSLDAMSEACTWAYALYIPALLLGISLYLAASIVQAIFLTRNK
jgi:hypothetical protein